MADGRSRKWLDEHAGLPKEALDILLDPHPRGCMAWLPEGVVGILEDLHHDYRGDPEGFGKLRFFVTAQRVITLRLHPLKTVDDLHRRLQAGGLPGSPSAWLEAMIAQLVDNFSESVRSLTEQVDGLEDEVIDRTSTQEHRLKLAAIRRLLVRFRRHVQANRQALHRIRGDAHYEATSGLQNRQAIEQLEGVAQDLELVHERVRLLQEEVSSLLAEASSRNLYVLSIVTTALLPATLVTGLWGMNVGGIPWADDANGILWAVLSVVGSILFSLVLLRGTHVL